MTPIVSTLLAALRPKPDDQDCPVCRHAVHPDEARMRLPGGGYVHRDCSTYRMRRNERIRRALA